MATSKYFKAKATTSRMSTRGSPSPDKDTETRGSPPPGEGDHNTVDIDNLSADQNEYHAAGGGSRYINYQTNNL